MGGADAWSALALMRGLLERAERLSEEYWVPRIDREDGLVLAAISFMAARDGGLYVDAGAGVGYSSLWMLYGLALAGCRCRLVAVEHDPGRVGALRGLLDEAVGRLRAAGLEPPVVETVEGDALEYLGSVDRLDMVMVDIDKHGYPYALELLEEKLPSGGVAAFHNALGPMPLPPGFRERVEKGPWARIVLPSPQGLLVLRRL